MEDSARRLLERTKERLEEARRIQVETEERYRERRVNFVVLLLARDELQRAQREYERLLQELVPSAPRKEAPPRGRAKREAVSSCGKQYRQPKKPTCTDCAYCETRLEPLAQLCQLPGKEHQLAKGDSEPCEHFVAALPCPVCGHPIGEKHTRPPKYCSDRCRKLAWWRRSRGKGHWETIPPPDLHLGRLSTSVCF